MAKLKDGLKDGPVAKLIDLLMYSDIQFDISGQICLAAGAAYLYHCRTQNPWIRNQNDMHHMAWQRIGGDSSWG